MNSADRSIALLDTALRRRFRFEEVGPDPTTLGIVDGIDLQKLLATLNERIELLLDRDHRIGHAYFIKVRDFDSLCQVFNHQIRPLLEEYFHEDYGLMALVLMNRAQRKSEFVISEEVELAGVFGPGWEPRGRRASDRHPRHSFARDITPEMFQGLLS